MPAYLAPGGYIKETSYRSKTIEGVSTSTAGFVGPTRFGPIRGESELLTSFSDFELIYGGLDQLSFGDGTTKTHNYLAHSVRAFFEEGGKRLYVSRIFNNSEGAGIATASIHDEKGAPHPIILSARHEGAAGNVPVTFTFQLGQNVLTNQNSVPVLSGVTEYDVVWVKDTSSSPVSPPGSGTLYWLSPYFDTTLGHWSYKLRQPNDNQDTAPLVSQLSGSNLEAQVLTVNVTFGALGKFSQPLRWDNLSFHPEHRNALTRIFTTTPTSRATELYVPLIISIDKTDGVAIAETLLDELILPKTTPPTTNWADILNNPGAAPAALTFQVQLSGGNDGTRPIAADYEGNEDSRGLKSGFMAFEDLEDISIAAAPGSSYGYDNGYKNDSDAITRSLISHCEKMHYCIGILDSADGQLVSSVREYRGKLDSQYAALYYPWVKIMDPLTAEEILLPPSGFVAGIYARNDVEYGVHKAPANEVVRLAIGFEFSLNKAQQDLLNPEGINCFRFFDGRGYRLWGARTISSDPDWKYVNLRRYFAYLERSIEKNTQWVVFENNSTSLWNNIRSTVEDFLFNEWKSNHLTGDDPKEAYFVRCDRTTMTQNDIDNGRLICLIGIAPVRPMEFVIFRIGQWTADQKQ